MTAGKAQAVVIHGIRNCDTMRKARGWLDSRGIGYAFHDYRVAGITRQMLEGWVAQVGWEALLNRAGTTFRALPDAARQGLDADKAVELMQVQPAMIKRPVLLIGPRLVVGFKPEQYEAAFAQEA